MQPTIRFLPHATRCFGAAKVAEPAPSKSSTRGTLADSPPRIPTPKRMETAVAPTRHRLSPTAELFLRLAIVGALFALSFLLGGCANSYVNSPAAAAHRDKAKAEFSHPIIARAYNAKPAIHFPATIGLAPMDHETQLPLRNLDAAGKLDALKSLPQLANVTNVSSLLISTDGQIAGPNGQPVALWNKSDLALREAAARMHCDAVLLLKIDTTVTDGKIFAPLSLVTLGMFPNDRSEVISTALAALVDTRTGYVYATAERSAGKTCHTNSWDDDTRSRTMQLANQKAIDKLFADFPALWSGIVAKYK